MLFRLGKNKAFYNRLKFGVMTRGKPAGRLQGLDRKLKLKESVWPLLRARMRTHGACHPGWGKN